MGVEEIKQAAEMLLDGTGIKTIGCCFDSRPGATI
jgi:hypothetical protein